MALGAPMVRLVNRKQLTLNFEVKDVGPSGLSGVELWYTTDTKNWKKYDAPAQSNAYIIEVDAEGMYGLTLVARSGTALFVSPDPKSLNAETRQAIRRAFASAAVEQSVAEPLDWMDTTAPSRWRIHGQTVQYGWYGPEGGSPFPR